MVNDGKICIILGEMVENDERWCFSEILTDYVNLLKLIQKGLN